MNKTKLEKQLGNINVPEQLENRIRLNWQQQLREDSTATRVKSKWLLVSAASFLVGIILLRTEFSTPELVNAALEDIMADAKHKVGVSVAMDSILQINHISPIKNMPVSMTKYCTLEKIQTLHMQITGEHQGSVHLFVKENGFDDHFWQDSQGVKQQMIWKIIHPRDDLSVLVIHTQDMNPLNINKLVQHMFYS